ncbi:MAG: hypothetical protein CMJ44_11875 [Pimelobacter sp.]|nr:hypothetical protein [Pimelobacter sp.]
MIAAGPRRIRLTIAALLATALAPAVGGLTGPASAVAPDATATASVGEVSASPATTDDPAGVADDVFSLLPGFEQSGQRRALVEPTAYVAARVDLDAVGALLGADEAPARAARAGGTGPSTLALPAPDGTTALFSVVEDSVMAPRLQAEHPELRTYAGTGLTDPTDTVRLSLTPLGLHASVRSIRGNRSWYVEPAYYGRGVTTHLSFLRSAVPDSGRVLDEQEPLIAPGASDATARSLAPQRLAGEAVTQRTYRLAFVTEQSYAAYFGTENVMATKVIQVNRANQIYSDDMAITFVLAEGSDGLNLDTDAKAIGANGPCGASPCFTSDETSSCGGDILDRNKFVAGQIVGADRFDIGHFGSGDGSGGVAYLGVVGGPDKAGGCTALDPPAGDFYAVDFFAHEVGHQMAGNHTFDGASGSCAGANRNAPTSVEPGSGSSVMAYAGICFSDDLQPHTDPYFSQRTIDEFTVKVTEAPTNLAEEQSVNLAGFDAGDTFELTYPGAPAPVVLTRGGNYTAAGLEAAILTLTGTAADVTGYDGANAVGPEGFSVEFVGTGNLQRLGIGATTGGTTGFVGVIQNGGPTTQGGSATLTTNRAPLAVAPEDRTIPVSTPFALTGSATDADAGQQDALTYLWEQNDEGLPGDPLLGVGPGTPLNSPVKVLGPVFRVFGTKADVSDEDTLLYNSPGENLADGNPTRSFPDVEQILAEATNAEGPCPVPTTDPTSGMEGAALDCYSEWLPDPVYAATQGELNFRLTVRDGSPLGGGTGFDDVTLTLDPAAGPFLVSSRAEDDTTATAGETETVEWDVAGTAGLAENVRISISLDGGLTFDHVLAESTPNDGEEDVVLPELNAEEARIKVEAVDNYFFDINNAPFAITGGLEEPEEPEEPGTDAPRTKLTGGTERRSFVVGRKAPFEYSSSQAGSTFECAIDGEDVDCSESGTVVGGLKPGNHLFSVAARNSEGVLDRTPAKARFAVVANERVLTRDTRGWKTLKDKRAYKKTYLMTSKPKRVLSLEVEKVARIALLVSKAKGFGRLAVFLDGERLKVLKTQAKRPKVQKLKKVASFKKRASGTLTIKSLDKKPVQIDGIGIFNP